MWPDLIAKAKEGGLDVIQTYVFWNVHEPAQGQVCVHVSFLFRFSGDACLDSRSMFLQYNFEGRFDLVRFIKKVEAQGLYVSLRIGPFIQSEWKYGYICIFFFLLIASILYNIQFFYVKNI